VPVGDAAAHEPLIHRAVARHAASRPDATALIIDGRQISYEALDAAACTYARELSRRGVGVGQVIPTLLPRSAQLVALQLAILKCGAAYAGLDPRWPDDRLTTILNQVSPPLVVGGHDRGRFPAYQPPSEDVCSAAARAHPFDPVPVDALAAATVFFTSGTTGGPKGVVSPHQAVTRLFSPGGLEGFGPGHATPQAAPLPWDMYAFELWGQLTSGGTSVLVEGEHLLPGILRDLVRDCGVDTLWLTTSLFNLFVDEDPGCFWDLGQVLTGGEKLSPAHVRIFLEHHPGIPLRNGYGPAENCMLTTVHLLRFEDCDVPGGIPVGTPVPGTTVLVLDAHDQQCPPDEAGEICIAGQGLAIGYLGHPELTAAKFPTLIVDGKPLRIYRTGDIGVLDRTGVLHFRGRQDRQVKISGYRVEMAEIEVAARRVAGVRDCVALPVTAPGGEVSRLALFYLSDERSPGQSLQDGDPLGVRDELRLRLPAYLVPGVVWRLARFPVTANGKLDRAALLRLARRPGRLRRWPESAGTVPPADRAGGNAAVGSMSVRETKSYPMTYEQEAIWLDEYFDDGPSRYLESWVYRLSGPLDLDAVEWALARVVDRHEALHTRLTTDRGRLVQVVVPDHDTRLIRRLCPAENLDEELTRTVSQPLDLDISPLRATALQISPDESVLAVLFHHTVVDDEALAILDQEFGEFYTARVRGRPAALTPLSIQLGEYAVAQRSAGIDPAVRAYWRERLTKLPERDSVPPDRPPPAAPSHRGGQVRFRIGEHAGQLLRRVGRAQRTTPFTIFAAAVTALLSGYRDSSELILGTPVSKRGAASVDRLIGCLTNLLPLRQSVGPHESFADLVAATRSVVLGAIAHRDISYAELVALAGVRKDHRMEPLCQTALVVDDAPRVPLSLPGVRAERLYVPSGMVKFDLCLTLVIDGSGYLGFLDYASDLYSRAMAERIVGDFQALLAAALADPGRPLSELRQLPVRPGGRLMCERGVQALQEGRHSWQSE
jgi:D-alanine--poly(phosphoribitol) ligase subunit 1